MLQTEYPFRLPKGYVDADGNLHADGVMRLATAADELLPIKDPRVRQNEAYLSVILLSRVVVRLGSLDMITPKVIEGLFAADFAYLQDLYQRINQVEGEAHAVTCPKCGEVFEAGGPPLGES
ncbi:MAG: phage tail assembly protein [Caulobacter sp.]|nr:phage tail assembly protein [Caulobacter sp.]